LSKLSRSEYEDYWKRIHNSTEDDLASVCFPGKPHYFNRFFDRVQKYSLEKYFKNVKISFEGKKLLDIGCGRGRWLSFYEKRYKAVVTGIDLSRRAVETCRRKGFNAFRGSIIQLPFRDGCFDYINSITVLLHLPYVLKENAIAEISRVVRPKGKAILIEGTWKDPAPHVYGLNILEWEKHFNKYGMKLVHKSGHCFNVFRIKLPAFTPLRDFVAIHLDYPLEYALMSYFYGKKSEMALQHLMVFEKDVSDISMSKDIVT